MIIQVTTKYTTRQFPVKCSYICGFLWKLVQPSNIFKYSFQDDSFLTHETDSALKCSSQIMKINPAKWANEL